MVAVSHLSAFIRGHFWTCSGVWSSRPQTKIDECQFHIPEHIGIQSAVTCMYLQDHYLLPSFQKLVGVTCGKGCITNVTRVLSLNFSSVSLMSLHFIWLNHYLCLSSLAQEMNGSYLLHGSDWCSLHGPSGHLEDLFQKLVIALGYHGPCCCPILQMHFDSSFTSI